MDLDNMIAEGDSTTTPENPGNSDDGTGMVFQKTEDGKIIMDEKSFYSKLYGPMKTMEKRLTQMENEKRSASQDDDYSDVIADLVKEGYDEAEAKAIVATNKKMMAKQLQKNPNSDRPSADDMEEQKFLMAHPEMFDYIDEIKNVKKIAPSRSLTQIATSMGYLKTQQAQGNGSFRTSESGGGGSAMTADQKKEAEEKEQAQKDFDKLIGR